MKVKSILFWEGTHHCGSAVRDIQSGVDVLQVRAHRSLGQPELTGHLDVGATGSDEMQQLPLPGGEVGHGRAASLRVEVRLVEVRAQQREQRPVTLGEFGARASNKEQPSDTSWSRFGTRRLGQTHLDEMFKALWPRTVAVHARGMPLTH